MGIQNNVNNLLGAVGQIAVVDKVIDGPISKAVKRQETAKISNAADTKLAELDKEFVKQNDEYESVRSDNLKTLNDTYQEANHYMAGPDPEDYELDKDNTLDKLYKDKLNEKIAEATAYEDAYKGSMDEIKDKKAKIIKEKLSEMYKKYNATNDVKDYLDILDEEDRLNSVLEQDTSLKTARKEIYKALQIDRDMSKLINDYRKSREYSNVYKKYKEYKANGTK